MIVKSHNLQYGINVGGGDNVSKRVEWEVGGAKLVFAETALELLNFIL